ncbi:MAG: histidine kinase [Planctomycetota bacterium]
MTDSCPTVLFLSGDLLFASRINGAAQAAGLEFSLAGKLPEDASSVRWVIVDLATRSGVVEDLMSQCEQRCPDASVIAYGPHVQVDRLNRAREAGIPLVLTRGQFDRALSGLFTS